ncbi:PEP-CTERM sorting domain-containing protein [Thiohalocapsa halophila]|uniref:PEP-CTERM sorting domain-containing protein n=1 Tax=Thiohalocapsa halophila TaxID=69359 RepID=UPI00190664D1|nr:PEP-CTERM sorting domain-containing protein [Thiohalocapsa halophila]
MKYTPLLIVLALFATQAPAHLYFETFPVESQTPNEAGWKSYTGSTAQDLSDEANGTDGGTWITTGSDAIGSYIFEGNGWTEQPNLIFANNLPSGSSSINVSDITEITFHSRGDGNAGDFYLTVEVGGSWYRSTVGYNGGPEWMEHTLMFNPGPANWYAMDFTAGGTTASGGDYGGNLYFGGTTNPSSALSGTLNHLGFAIDPQTAGTGSANQRFDEITVMPEPSSLLLMATTGLAAFGLAAWRRKTR